MGKRFFEIYGVVGNEFREGCPDDLLILDNDEEIEELKYVLRDNYVFTEIKPTDDKFIDKLTYWLLAFKMGMGNKEHVGTVAVDSGQLLISDPCYLKDKDNDMVFESVCQTTGTHEKMGQVLGSLSFATSSGSGDGIYDVYAERDGEGNVASIEIRFD